MLPTGMPAGLDEPGTAEPRLRRVAALGCASIALVSVVTIYFAEVKLPELPSFVWAQIACYLLADMLTLALLAQHARAHPSRSVGLLAGAYLFSAFGAAAFFATFPGAILAGPAMGGPQSSSWWYFLWRMGFMGGLLLSSIAVERDLTKPLRTARLTPYVLASTLIAAAIAVWTIAFADDLPVMLDRTQPSPVTWVGHAVSRTTLAICIVTLIGCLWAARRNARLRVWLVPVAALYTADVGIQQFAVDRYTVAWYGARVLGALGACILAILMVSEFSRTSDALVKSMDRQEEMWELIQGAEDGFLVVDAKGRILWANARATEMFDHQVTASKDLTHVRVVEILPQFKKFLGGPSVGPELTTACRGHDTFPVSVSTREVHTRQGRVRVVYVRDATAEVTTSNRLADAERTNKHLAQVVAQSPVGYCVLDGQLHITDANDSLSTMLGYATGQLVGLSCTMIQSPNSSPALGDVLTPLLAGSSRRASCRTTLRQQDGSKLWVDALGHPLIDAEGQLTGIALSFVDVSTETAAEAADHARIGIAATDQYGLLRHANDAFCRIVGIPRENLIENPLAAFVDPDDKGDEELSTSLILRGSVQSGTSHLRFPREGASPVWAEVHRAAIEDEKGGVSGVTLQIIDVTAQKKAEAAVESVLADLDYRSNHDMLTGLANRDSFKSSLEQILERSVGTRLTGILFVDIDNFKQINDAVSHTLGDTVLRQLASVLTDCVRAGDLVARLSGDEFAIALVGITRIADAAAVAEKIVHTVSANMFGTQEHRIHVTVSVGVTATNGAARSGWLLQEADVAMYRAKQSGRNRWMPFDESLRSEMVERIDLAARIRGALERDEFEPHYQPIHDLRTGALVGFEALARWIPSDGSAPANSATFLKVAEETNLVVPLGGRIIDKAMAGLSSLPGNTSLALNVSPSQLLSEDVAGRILNAIEANRADPRRVVVEITEAALLRTASSTIDAIERLAREGVGIHVDDFGTGYSSLTHLRDYPVTGVKLDKSFTADVRPEGGQAAELAAGLASLADRLGLTTIAEGIETAEMGQSLLALGWAYGQGWHLGMPTSIVDLRRIAKAQT